MLACSANDADSECSSTELNGDLLQTIRQEISTQLTQTLGNEILMLKLRVTYLEDKLRMSKGPLPAKSPVQFSMIAGRTEDSGTYSALIAEPSMEKPMDEAVESIADVDSLPESLLNYCMAMLTASPNPWCDSALRKLLLLFLVQQSLMIGFSQVNFNTLIKQHWQPVSERGIALMDCTYASREISGVPFLFLLVSLIAMYLVCLTVKADTQDALRIIHPGPEKGICFCVLVNMIWFLQVVFLPGIFSVETAALFASSSDTMAVVLNTLAVTFILETDNMLYEALLDDKEKDAYQKLAENPHFNEPRDPYHLQQASTFMYFTGFAVMVVHFCGISFFDHLAGIAFQEHMLPLYASYLFMFGFRGAALVSTRVLSAEAACSRVFCCACAAFLVSFIAGPIWFFSLRAVTAGNHTLDVLDSCLNQTDA